MTLNDSIKIDHPQGGTIKLSFPGPIGTKRRRMRSGGSNLHREASVGNNSTTSPVFSEENVSEQKTTQTSKCKGATTIPIFLKKTYKMVDTCDPSIASWTEDGDMFVVKDPEVFASQVIPQYFDHNKFSSFARQLNFYGFRKMQSKPIRNSDFDAETAKHVTFFNENFKRGRCDLLKKIQRSTRGGGSTNPQDQSREMHMLRDQISNLEMKMVEMEAATEERVRRLELDMLARMEQMMLTVQQQQQAQLQLEKATSIGTVDSNRSVSSGSHHLLQQHMLPQQRGIQNQSQQQMHQSSMGNNGQQSNSWESGGGGGSFPFSRGNSLNVGANVNSVVNSMNAISFQQQPSQQVQHQQQQQQQQQLQQQFQRQQQLQQNQPAPPTLPPHPKQKMLPMGLVPGMMGAPPDRLNSLRGISTLSGLSRMASVESNGVFDETLFNLLMMENSEQNGTGNSGSNPGEDPILPTPMVEPHHHSSQNIGMLNIGANGPVTISNSSSENSRIMRGQQDFMNREE